MLRHESSTVLVGRTHELAVLHNRLGRAGDGAGGCLVLSGEGGIGKSRLVAETHAAAAARGFGILSGTCFSQDRSLPYAPLLDLLRGVCTGRGAADLAALLGHAAPELAALLPELAGRLPGLTPTPLTGSEREKRRLFQAFIEFFVHQAARAPLLIVLEDLHWSDDSSLEFLPTLARRIAAQPILLLLTCRTRETSAAPQAALSELVRARLADELPLPPLTWDETVALVRNRRAGTAPPSHTELQSLYALSEGNPFFIEELLQVWPARTEAFGEDDRLALPRSIQGMIRPRLAALSEEARATLQLAAVAGRRIDYALLQALTGSGEAELLRVLHELIAAHLFVEESADRFAFRHALTQQTVAAELLARERRALHGRVADALIGSGAVTDEGLIGELAYHCLRAERWPEAIAYARRAGERALLLHAPRAAAEQLTRAVEAAHRLGVPPDFALLRARGRAWESLGEFDRARSDYEAAHEQATRAADRGAEWQALIDLGALWASRDYGRTGAFYRRALALARELGDPAKLGHSLNRLGNWHVNLDQPWLGMPWHAEALAIFRQMDDRPGTAETLDLMGLAHACHGDLIRAAACLDEAIALLRALGAQEALVTTLTMRQSVDPTYETATMVPPAPALARADAIQPAGEALQLARSLGLRGDEPFALFIQAQSLAVHGNYAAALPLAWEALAIAEETGHAQWRTGAEYALGAIALDLGDPRAAVEHLERAVALANEIGSLTWLRIASGELGAACVAAGELARAEAVLLAATGGERPLETIGGRLVGAGQAELALARGEAQQALQLVDQLIATAPHARETAIPRLWLLRGEALAALGRLGDAEAMLLEAQAAATALRLRPLHWRVHAALGHVLWAAGRRAAARAAFAAAETQIAELAAELPEALQTAFRRGALARLPRPPRAGERSDRTRLPDRLTPREAEILRLLARGHDNRAIARTLVLSERTVEGHIANVYAKIGAAGRTARAAAAAYALHHGLAGEEAGSQPA